MRSQSEQRNPKLKERRRWNRQAATASPAKLGDLPQKLEPREAIDQWLHRQWFLFCTFKITKVRSSAREFFDLQATVVP
jgi:hypothetical protein